MPLVFVIRRQWRVFDGGGFIVTLSCRVRPRNLTPFIKAILQYPHSFASPSLLSPYKKLRRKPRIFNSGMDVINGFSVAIFVDIFEKCFCFNHNSFVLLKLFIILRWILSTHIFRSSWKCLFLHFFRPD